MKKPLLDRQLHKLLPMCNKGREKKALRRIHHKLMKQNGCERRHDAMVLTAAFFLLHDSHEVKVEYLLPSDTETLYADIYASKDAVTRIFEVELLAYRGNFIPVPGSDYYRRLSKDEYFGDRIIGKVARYWPYANEFYLVYAFDNKESLRRYADLLGFFHSPVGEREKDRTHEMALGVENVYASPKIPEERVRNARLSGVYGVDISDVVFEPMSPF